MSDPIQSKRLMDDFIPKADMRERHSIIVRAPAAVVMEVARHFDMQSIPLVRAIFWLRGKILGSQQPGTAPRGLVTDTLSLGWGVLHDQPQRMFIAGAACQPWQPDVVFTPIPAEQFVDYAEPDCVKILWTLEAEEQKPERTRFSTETRVAATDERARKKFRRYWRVYGVGILMIRWLVLPAMRRQAERSWKDQRK